MPVSDLEKDLSPSPKSVAGEGGEPIRPDVLGLLDNMLNGIAYCRMVFKDDHPYDFIYVYTNSAFHIQTGLGDVIGRPASEIIPGIRESDRELLETYGRVVRSGEPEKFETFVRGLQQWFSISVYSPHPDHFVAVFDVITERKLAEERLRQSEASFRLLAEAMPQIVWVTRADGWNTYFNQQWVDYTGLTLEESYGHGWNKPFHPDDQKRAWDAWQNAINNNGTYSLDCRLRKADGSYHWWLIRGVPVFDEHGKINQWFGTCTDVDEIKRTEAALRLQSEITENSAEGIALIRAHEGTIHYANRQFETLFGYASGDTWHRGVCFRNHN